MATVSVRMGDTYRTTLETRGHTWIADEPANQGGEDTGPTPMELLLSALGACAAITARMYALRKGWPLEGVDVDVSMQKFKKDEYPAYTGTADIVNEMRQRITFHGPLTDDQRARLLDIAAKCPVHRALTQPNFIIEEMVDAETPVVE